MRIPLRHIALFLAFPGLCTAIAARAETVRWGTFNKDYNGQRYSDLKQITASNVARLKPLCEAYVEDPGTFEAGPVIVDSLMFVTTGHTTVAIDATNCDIIWQHIYVPEQDEVYSVNRGVAYADGRVYRGTADGRLLAIDARTGKEIWRVKAADPTVGQAFNSAPIVWKGRLYTGIVNSDYAIQGRMMAYDVKDGRELWRFNVVPSAGEFGYDTWKNRGTAERGGGGTWSSYSLDPKTGELFIPVANPWPAYDPDTRPGDNLFTNSVLVLDAITGKYKWHYQLIAHDGLDRDVAAAPMLFVDHHGKPRVAAASKNGFMYSIDRDSHQLVWKAPVTTIMEPPPKATATPTRSCPGMNGGVEWNGPAYDRRSGALIVGSMDGCDMVFLAKQDFSAGKLMLHGGTQLSTEPADIVSRGWVTDIDATSGAVRWKYHADSPVIGAVTPTAGGVVFTGEIAGNLLALDAGTGRELLKYPSGGAVAGGVVTYEIGKHQYVAFLSGNVSRGPFYSIDGEPKVVIMALGTGAKLKTTRVAKDGALPSAGPSDIEVAFHTYFGQKAYNRYCAACHGGRGDGSTGPALRGVLDRRKDQRPLGDIIRNPKSTIMPRFYPKPLTDVEVDQIVAFLQSWK